MSKIIHALCTSFIFLNLACDLLEPERFYNEQAKPPQVQILNIRDIKPGQHLAGIIQFTIDLEGLSSPAIRVDLLVDSALAFSALNHPFTLTLDTQSWPQGEHVISVGAIESRPNTGLLGIVGFPSVIFTARVVFDQTPPTAVVLHPIVLENGSPRLTWSQNNDLNFFAYLITRDGNWGPFGADLVTIYDRSSTSFLDAPIPQIYGVRFDYHIHVTNHAESAPSNIVTIRYGPTIAASPFSSSSSRVGPRPILNPIHDEMYILEPGPHGGLDTLMAVSTISNVVVRNQAMPNSAANFAVSKDGTKLYIFADFSPTFMVLNAVNFNVLNTAEVSFTASSIVAGRDDRLYIATAFPFPGPVKIIDANSGAEVSEIAINAPKGLLAISPDNNSLFVADVRPELFTPAKVYRIDIATDNGLVVGERIASDVIRAMQLSPDGQHLFVLHDNDFPTAPNEFVDVWDAATLNSIARLSIPLVGDQRYVFDVFATFSHVYVSFSHYVPEARYFLPGRVVQFDGAGFSATKFWDFVQVPQMILSSNDNRYLYAFGFEPWIVTIN